MSKYALPDVWLAVVVEAGFIRRVYLISCPSRELYSQAAYKEANSKYVPSKLFRAL